MYGGNGGDSSGRRRTELKTTADGFSRIIRSACANGIRNIEKRTRHIYIYTLRNTCAACRGISTKTTRTDFSRHFVRPVERNFVWALRKNSARQRLRREPCADGEKRVVNVAPEYSQSVVENNRRLSFYGSSADCRRG